MTSKEFQPISLLTVAGTVLIAVLAIVWSARAAAVVAGCATLSLAWMRFAAKRPDGIAARSTRFDTLFLGILGAGILALAITADNI